MGPLSSCKLNILLIFVDFRTKVIEINHFKNAQILCMLLPFDCNICMETNFNESNDNLMDYLKIVHLTNIFPSTKFYSAPSKLGA